MEPPAGASAPPTTVRLSRDELTTLAGIYRGERPNRVLTFVMDGDSLRVGSAEGPALRPLGQRRFAIGGSSTPVVFTQAEGADWVARIPGQGSARRTEPWHPDEDELRSFAGVYRSDELGTEYRVAFQEGQLRVHHRKLETRAMTPTFRDAFLVRGASAVFTRAASGAIDGFTLSDGRVWNVRFRRDGG